MSKGLIVIIVLVLIALVVFGQYVGVRNTLVTKNEAVKAAWSQVDIVLQRRADLIPNLVETVKGIAKQEQTVFGDIAKARSQLLSAGTPSEKIAANQQLDGALGRLLAIAENYPQLKSNENFLRLQDELAGTENRIAVDLKRQPDLLLCVDEAQLVPALGEFLTAINSSATILETAKCDTWQTTDMKPEEEIFGANSKFGSYIDLLFTDEPKRFSFSEHEQLATRLTQLLRRVPEIPAAAEFLVRRCHYHEDENHDGFYITFHLF